MHRSRGFTQRFRGIGRRGQPPLEEQLADLHRHLDRVAEDVGWGVVRLDQVEATLHALRAEVGTAEPSARQAYLDTQSLAELSFGLERLAAELTGQLTDATSLLEDVRATLDRAGVDDLIDERARRDRIEQVDLPFAYAAAAGLPSGAPVATIGEDPGLRTGLASLGLHVTTLADTDGPSLGAVFCLAKLPELQPSPDESPGRAARASLAELATRLAPGGELLLTLPFGRYHGAVDRATLDRLVEGWETRQRSFARRGTERWEREDCTWPPETAEDRVVLLRLAPAL